MPLSPMLKGRIWLPLLPSHGPVNNGGASRWRLVKSWSAIEQRLSSGCATALRPAQRAGKAPQKHKGRP